MPNGAIQWVLQYNGFVSTNIPLFEENVSIHANVTMKCSLKKLMGGGFSICFSSLAVDQLKMAIRKKMLV